MTNPIDTVTDLAGLLDVNRRRISKWREEGAPTTLDLDQWRTWLNRTGRTHLALRLVNVPTATSFLAAPEAAAAAIHPLGGSAEASGSAIPGPIAPPSGQGGDERYWRTRKWQEQALAAESARLVAERQLWPMAEVTALMTSLATTTVGCLTDTVWLKMLPLLDGLSPELRKALRRAHDEAVLDVRTRLSREIHDRLQAAINSTPSP